MSSKSEHRQMTRRKFLQAASVGAAVLMSNRAALSAATPLPSQQIEHGSALLEFGYGDVQFAPGPHEAQLEQTHAVLMGLSDDGLLRPYRMAVGLPAPGHDLGGWYSAPRFLAETFGQWISALSHYYVARGDGPTRLKVEGLMRAFLETLEPTGKLYRVNGNPLYFHDKLVIGITDSLPIMGEAWVRDALTRFAGSSHEVFARKHSAEGWSTPDNIDGAISLSGYNFAETYLNAWLNGGDARYLELAKQDLQDGFCEPLSRGENVLPRRHAYAHINTLCSAAKAYLVLGDEKYLRAAVNGLAFAEQQSFATGGYGPGEGFLPKPAIDYAIPETGEKKHLPAVETLGDSILQDHHHFETGCGSYAHFKLTRYLLRITQNPHYGDSMERVMYNAALGALPINKFGKAFYQSNYSRRAKKEYFDGYGNVIEDEWPCCSGTLPQLAADYRISTYFRDSKGVFVNLYIPSTLRWSQGGEDIALTQAGDYPLSDRVAFSVETSRSSTFTLRFRVPAWAQQPVLRVNGTPVSQRVEPASFAAIRRQWRSGDKVELVLPKRLDLKPVDDQHPDLVAVCCGPLVLFAIGEDLPKLDRQMLLAAKQVVPGKSEWRSSNVTFLPWWIIKDEIYTTYHDVS